MTHIETCFCTKVHDKADGVQFFCQGANLSKKGHQIVISLRTQICIKPKVSFCKEYCCQFLSVSKAEEDKAAAAKNKS